jgi:uncharacterized protein
MPTYKTPGVYIEEISAFPPSIAAVETAIPAFIGFTEKVNGANGDSLVNQPIRITSLLEFQQIFGFAPVQLFSVDIEQTLIASTNQITETKVTFNGTPPTTPSHFLYYSMQLFYANGGGPCYVISIGDYSVAFADNLFTNAITALEAYDEPTLLVFPDACLGNDTQLGDIVDVALGHCQKMQDRFTIIDVRNAVPGGTETNTNVTDNFRNEIASDLDLVKYGAAYYPYLRTSLFFNTNDDNIEINSHTVNSIAADGTVTSGDGALAPSNNGDNPFPISSSNVKENQTAIYNAVKQFITTNGLVTIPPSGAIAGVYARVDNNRGVWKAPANVSLSNVISPAITITNDLNDGLNIDPGSGKSVNAIRSFVGKGTLVWGARTLAGNDNENRYVPVRRFLIFAEESIKKAIATFVFEPNDANTWVKVRSMIESFLTTQWRDGALAGAKPEDAFQVAVGLNKTMTAQDILDGYMIVEIKLAIVRPAEFIVLRFSQLMQRS